MKCHLCGKNEATIHYVEIVDGQKTSQWICLECAEKEGIALGEPAPLSHGGLEAFLGGMLSSTGGGQRSAPETRAEGPVCEVCGYPYGQFRERWLLGCPACYGAFREQLLQIEKMGGMGKMLDKLPGMGNLPDSVKAQVEGNPQKHLVAIINSMTPHERQHPAIIKASRKKRIAAGSGTSVQEINRLLKQFNQMQKMMKRMGKGKRAMRGLMQGMGGMPGMPFPK